MNHSIESNRDPEMNAVSHLSSTATSNTCLAAALTAVGIPLSDKPFVRVVGDGIRGERTVWFFDPQSPDGRFQTKELIAAWHDDTWHLANPEHPDMPLPPPRPARIDDFLAGFATHPGVRWVHAQYARHRPKSSERDAV